jgi:hypothetical protein
MSVLFNTTSVETLDKLGKLYKTAIPQSDDRTTEALVYSTATIVENKLKPITAVYLKNNDATSDEDKSYFSIDRIGKNINLVASASTLNLYVYSPPVTGEVSGSVDKYQFNAVTGVQSAAVTLTNPIDIAAEELISNRDLDGNAGIGGLLPATNSTLDKIGNLFKVKVAGQDMLIVGAAVSAKSKSIDIATNVLKTSEGLAWMPDVAYDSYSAVKSNSGWEIFAVKNGIGSNQATTVTQYSFDNNRQLVVNNYSDSKALDAFELAEFEKTFGRNLNNDSFMGVAITAPIDAAGGLYKANILNEDFYVVDTTTTGKGLKSGTTAATALDLSGTLMADDGLAAWKEPTGFTLSAMVKGAGGSSLKVFLTKNAEPTGPKTVLQFDFNLDIASGNFLVAPGNTDGIEIDPIALAEFEKSTKRDLNKDGDFGIKVGANLDKAGGLYMAEALGRTYLVAGKNLVSNAKNITDLSSALTMDGAAWKPDGMTDDQLTGKINIVISSTDSSSATVYVKEDDGFAKYEFTRTGTSPWTTEGERIALDSEEMAQIEKTTGRDLNSDNMYGAKIVSLKNAPGGLYTASYDTLGSDSTKPIFIRSATKLTVGASNAANSVDFRSALKTGGDFWSPPEDYTVTGAYQDPDTTVKKYHVIVVNNKTGSLDTSDFKRYSFSTDPDVASTLNKLDESSTTELSAKELSVIESQLKRDLNDDKIIGARVLATVDKVGLLFKVEGASKETNGSAVVTFAAKATPTSPLNNLSTSFVQENGAAWQPADLEDVSKFTLINRTSGSGESGYDIYTKSEKDNKTVFTKYSFDTNYTLKSEKTINLVDLANDETDATRDINGDGVIGAKVLNAIDKAAGLYRVSIENKFMMVSTSTANPPVKQTSLRNVLLGENSSPMQINANSEILDDVGDTTGFKVRSAFTDALDTTLFKVFATKTNSNGTGDTADDFSDVKQITFKVNNTAIDYADYKRVETSVVLDAKSLVDAEKLSGKDLNSDLAVGAKIGTAVDKRGGLYSTKVLGSTYYFYDSLNKKSGTSTSTAIDLSQAFLDDNSEPWKVETDFNIGGVVKNDSNGYDIYTYKYTSSPTSSQFEYEVNKHSWDDAFVYIGSKAVDAAALVSVEKDNARDLSGDRVVGFNLINNPMLKGVTEAKVLGGQESKFLVVGDKLKAGSPTMPWKLSDALLTEDGTGPWSPPADYSVTAVRDSGGDRFVYAKTSGITPTVNKYVFEKATGKYTGTEQTLTSIQLAAEEMQFSKDLNGDTKLGVALFSDVKVGATSSGADMSSVMGKSSGLMKSTINGVNYLVAQITPNPNARVNLEMALLNEDGTAWMPDSGFVLAGIYKPDSSGKTEVYGTVNGSLRRYEFSLSNMVSDSVSNELGYTSTPQVLKLSKQTVDGNELNYVSVTDIQIADREDSVQKDLNNDSLVGFKLGTKLDTLANGTTLATAGMGSGVNLSQIYIVGKSVASLGSIGYGTANGSALRSNIDGPKTYWQPDTDYEVKSILESADTVKVYASIKASSLAKLTEEALAIPEELDPNQMQEYTFTKDGTQGWLLQSNTLRNSAWLIESEVASKRDLNKDTSNIISGVGLAYKKTDAFNIANSGLIKGSFGNREYIFAGQNLSSLGTFANPLGLTNVGGPQLLKDTSNNAWATSKSIQSFAAKTSTTAIPTNINSTQVAYVLSFTDESKVYFDSSYKALPESPVRNTDIDLLDRVLKEDVKFSFYLPEFATAAAGDDITYSFTAKFDDGSNVPNDNNWLSLNETTGNFTGTPTNVNVTDSDFTVTVKATSSDGIRFVSSSFKVEVANANDVPVRTSVNVPNVNLEVGSSFEFFLPEGSFSDDDGSSTLIYSFTDDSGLPDADKWLILDGSNQRFSGTVPSSWSNSSMSVTVRASDSSSNETESSYATASFTINFNNKPVADTAPLVDQTVTVGQAFEYVLNMPFSDVDSDNLTLTAIQSNGDLLPTWLEFDGTKFNYKPSGSSLPADALTVKVIASDGKGSTAESTFNITINEAPKLIYPLDDVFVQQNTSGTFTIPAASFADPEGTTLTYTAQLQNGNDYTDLPSELEFDAVTRTFTYTDSIVLTSALSIKVTASDGFGTSSSTFKLDKQ